MAKRRKKTSKKHGKKMSKAALHAFRVKQGKKLAAMYGFGKGKKKKSKKKASKRRKPSYGYVPAAAPKRKVSKARKSRLHTVAQMEAELEAVLGRLEGNRRLDRRLKHAHELSDSRFW